MRIGESSLPGASAPADVIARLIDLQAVLSESDEVPGDPAALVLLRLSTLGSDDTQVSLHLCALRTELLLSNLPLQVEDLEDRHVQRDDHGADHAAEEGDHQRLDERGERLGGRLDLLVVELADLRQHLVEENRVFQFPSQEGLASLDDLHGRALATRHSRHGA